MTDDNSQRYDGSVDKYLLNDRFVAAVEIVKPVVVEIEDVRSEELGLPGRSQKSNKLWLKLKGKQKGLVLNKTKIKVLRKLFGSDSADWIGQKIKLVQGTTRRPDLGGAQGPCINVEKA